ncbi:phage tail protein [Bartonella sp. ML71XJBT]|uniref:phage tail protein n=1 Tax=Bartonella sp. ML71XJBT TaxID=3019094 RepID=UPI00236201E7|nr:phage tail protein [Bartonella sp. ML71XJBT]
MLDIYDWSLTASENAGADNMINWSEGQAPHTVNDSARAMMQRVREYLSCSGGGFDGVVQVNDLTQSSRIVFENSVFSGYQDGFVLRFRAVGWNFGRTTVYREGLPTKPIYQATENGLSSLVGGEIAHGCLYSLVYDASLSGWHLLNPTIRKSLYLRGLPTGFIGCFAMERLPSGWLLCDGRSYSRDKYRDLFATIGTLWGHGGDETTFNVPDLRGMFLRGFDYLGSVDRGRDFGSVQQSSLRDHEHIFPFSSESNSRTSRAVSSGCLRNKRSVVVEVETDFPREDDVSETKDTLQDRKGRRKCFAPNLWGEDNLDCFGGGQDALPSRRPSLLNEECLGLTGDALKECSREFDRVTSSPPPEERPPQMGKVYTSHPFFLKHEGFYVSEILNPSGEDLGEHDHSIMMDSFGGVESRPMNVSVVYGIKT